jgi:hypothetical protein
MYTEGTSRAGIRVQLKKGFASGSLCANTETVVVSFDELVEKENRARCFGANKNANDELDVVKRSGTYCSHSLAQYVLKKQRRFYKF